MRRRSVGVILAHVLALTLAVCACALADSSVSWEWGTTTNPATPGQFYLRDCAVDQLDGSIYVAQAAVQSAQGTTGSVVKLGAAGNILWSKGPELRDAGDVVRATIPLNSPSGVAVDPLTRNVYVLIREPDNTTAVHVLNMDGVWLSSFPTGLPEFTLDAGAAYGGAFSDDGQSYLIAGLLEKLPGTGTDTPQLGDTRGAKFGGKLFVRDDNGTPLNYLDDAWVAEAELTDNGEFWDGFVDPRGTCFDRQGRPYVSEGREHAVSNWYGNPYVRSFDASAPYVLERCLVTGTSGWAIDTDSSNNLWAAWGRDRTGVRNVRCVNPEGIRLIGFLPSSSGGAIIEPHSVACDRTNNKVIVAGAVAVGSGNTEVKVEKFSATLELPPTHTVTGRVVDKTTGDPIPNANVGYRSAAATDFPANPAIPAFGYWERGRADANGDYSFTMIDTTPLVPEDHPGFPVVPVASAPGHVSKRVYSYLIGDDPNVPDQRLVIPDIQLDSDDVDSLSIRLYGKEGSFDPQEEESGLFWVYRSSGSLVSQAAGGEPAARLGSLYSGGSGWYTRHLHFQVDDRWMSMGQPFDKVWVTVEYFGWALLTPGSGDLGTWDTIALEADVQGFSDYDRNAWVGEHYKEISQDDPQWVSVTFPIDKAYFANRGLKGSDFRINAVPPPGSEYVDGYSGEWIRRVTISKVPPTENYPVQPSVAAAKQGGVGAVVLENPVVTAQWDGNTFYVEQQDRAAGIRVKLVGDWSIANPNNLIGRLTQVQGTLQIDPSTGEAEIIADNFGGGSLSALAELRMNGKNVDTVGVDPTGLKVGVWGTVTSTSQPDSFTIDDGAGDLKVQVGTNVGLTWPAVGDYVYVIGIASLEGATPETAIRVIKPWADDAVTIEADAE